MSRAQEGMGPGGAWKGLDVVINGGQSSAHVQGERNVLSLPKWKVPVNSTSDAPQLTH